MSITFRVKKRYIIMAIIAIVVMCAGVIRVDAAEAGEEAEETENKTYTFTYVQYGATCTSQVTYDVGYNPVMYWDNEHVYQIVSNGVDRTNFWVTSSNWENQEYCTIDSYVNEIGSWWLEYYSDNTFTSDKYVTTNIPIFANETLANQYLQGDIGIDQSLNYEDIVDVRYDLEVPQNLKIEYSDGIFEANKYSMFWEQTDENYKNWETEVYIYVTMRAWEGILGIKIGDTVYYEDLALDRDVIPTYKLKYVIDTGSDKYEKLIEGVMDYIWNDNAKLTGSAEDYYKIYMRNAYFDGELKHYSNWLQIEIDYDWVNGEESSTIVEINGNIKDTPGQGKPGEDIKGDINNESQYDGAVDGNVIDSSGDLLSWIKNGFGLLGNNGIIALIREALDFVPSFVWAILGAGLSLMVAIGVVKYIF